MDGNPIDDISYGISIMINLIVESDQDDVDENIDRNQANIMKTHNGLTSQHQ